MIDVPTLRIPVLDEHLANCVHQYLCGMMNTLFTPTSGGAKAWSDMLENLAHPKTIGNVRFAGLLDAPAGKAMHHPERHGLLRHLLDMIQDWYALSQTPGNSISLLVEQYAFSILRDNPSVTCREDAIRMIDQMVITGILSHDIHKASLYYTMTDVVKDEEVVGVTFDYGDKHRSLDLPDIHKSLLVLADHGILPTALLLQQINDAEGGYAKMPSRTVNVLTKIVYLLDEMSVLRWRAFAGKLENQRK